MNATPLLPLIIRLPLTPWLRRWCQAALAWWPRRAPPAVASADDAAQPEPELPRGCGWFDSSHDLQQGLRVQEHLNPDSLARELPLAAWLELQLSGWRAATPAAAQGGLNPAA